MGGGGWYYVPRVWTPSGGWWHSPPNWKQNTGIAGIAALVLTAAIFRLSASLERRPISPSRHIPSQYWCKHAIEDDPSLASR